jgi:hypothetical protein
MQNVDMNAAQKPNAQYNVADPSSLPIRIATQARRRIYERFLRKTSIQPAETLLDVGVTSDRSYESSNYLEAWYPHKNRITAVGIDDAEFLEQLYPGLTYRRADGRSLPFADDSFDVVHSSAVLQHVGSADNQKAFIAELTRVAKRVVFITTPNRWFPIEVHTVLPLVHWLPPQWFRRVLRGTKYSFFAMEDNLNLLCRKDILRLCRDLRGCSITVEFLSTLGMPSNLLLTIEKRPNGVSDS